MTLKIKTVTQAFWLTIRHQSHAEVTHTLLVLQSFYALYTLYPEARDYFNHPKISIEDKRKRIKELMEVRGSNSNEARRFLEFLLKAGDFHRLSLILPLLHEWRNKELAITSVKATSAEPLDEEQRTFLKQKIQQTFGSREVELHESVDAELLGGIVLRMNGGVFDASLKKKLRTIRRVLKT